MMDKTIAELEAELKAAEAARIAAELKAAEALAAVVPEGVEDAAVGSNYVATPENDGHPGYEPPHYSDADLGIG